MLVFNWYTFCDFIIFNGDVVRMTTREKEVAALVLDGKTNHEIGLALGITEKTVKFHTEKIYKQYGVKSRAQFIVKMYRDMIDDPYEDSYKAYVDMGDFL